MVTTRTAKEADAPGLLVLFQQLGYPIDLDNLQSLLREQNPYRYALIAQVKGRLSGVIVVNLIDPMHEKGRWGLISALVIDESCRGMGVGRILLVEAERIAAASGCRQIELSSSERREQAHKFYQNNGYKEVRKRFLKSLIS
ncbi:TPA: GNAT family N-acetyltransferase [Klebsiella oxytoca]|uniref:GNAT family N-acetyltransferase n=1 Tax=Klebsiella oxytoca TaxID=571 RepID=A0AAP2BGF6_KLEOX|nr:GNAT family N-acetyltransferase [Klebsiella oxytoca]EJB5617291.1 GNAT family N-acetyltransferase [Klebsiella oxytoca]EJZ8383135.1 GNAT family N-acetyltransferase [Klebsiella oxytoca]EKH6433114.1 GNAT family N-acetyltransferase [Klebsiella oxytoca]EKJ7585488.1 GNAT family N-acetyltransferase [Klebsiella oxytoca]EKU6742358.1 GNAT family N-acetyltransferase [Klebsiella oxytoca]